MKRKIVSIGGGTGLSVLLYGLKKYFYVTAAVTVGDNGGGSGILREDLNMLPPGDIRNCILALSDAPDDLRKLLSYRFTNGNLKGQSLGNLIIAGMSEEEGSFEAGISLLTKVLKLQGEVHPVSNYPMDLVGILSDGSKVIGESEIAITALKRHAEISELSLLHSVPIQNEVVRAIRETDVITLGPGSLYTSVICNLLVSGMKEEIRDKKIIYFANVMTQPEETFGYSLSKHVTEIERYLDRDLDFVFANDVRPPDEILKKYAFEGSEPVISAPEDEKFLGNKLIKGEFFEVKRGYIRSNSNNIAEKLLEVLDG